MTNAQETMLWSYLFCADVTLNFQNKRQQSKLSQLFQNKIPETAVNKLITDIKLRSLAGLCDKLLLSLHKNL